MTVTFADLNLPATILAAIQKLGFTAPTPIQAEAIPIAMAGLDVLGSAQTGTGKTAAFGIPMIAKLIAEPKSMAIVMTPTRELATQVLSTLKPLLANHRDIKHALLIGGEPMPKQYTQLKMQPRIIVGTPGRINDHLERKSLDLRHANFLVLDETDRMLDMGFGVQIDRILKFMPAKRQTLLFSATIPAEIEKMAQRYQNNPKRIAVGSTNTPTAKIKQELLHLKEGEKYEQLIGELHDRKGSVIVFVKTKFGAKRMAEKLVKEDIKADAIHGNLNQNKRDRVIQAFRDKKYRVLVATDVAARGLDIPHIEHVINYDLPQCPEDYIHRVGRTARAGAEGSALAFITPSDNRLWHAINRLMNPDDKTPQPRDEAGVRSNRSGGNRRGDARGSSRKFGSSFGEKKFGEKKFAPRGERGAERSGERSARPARFDRAPRAEGSARPARTEGSRPVRAAGERPARVEGFARPARSEGSDRPARTTRRPVAGADRPDRPARSNGAGGAGRYKHNTGTKKRTARY